MYLIACTAPHNIPLPSQVFSRNLLAVLLVNLPARRVGDTVVGDLAARLGEICDYNTVVAIFQVAHRPRDSTGLRGLELPRDGGSK